MEAVLPVYAFGFLVILAIILAGSLTGAQIDRELDAYEDAVENQEPVDAVEHAGKSIGWFIIMAVLFFLIFLLFIGAIPEAVEPY